jgi:hypothetical protein
MHAKFCLDNFKGTGCFGDRLSGREDNIKIDVQDVGWESVDSIHLTRVNVTINLFNREKEGNVFVLIVCIQVQVWTASQPGRPQSG